MTLLVVSEVGLRGLEGAIVLAAHAVSDTAGAAVILNTIDATALRSAALAALLIATGKVVWPGDERLIIRQPKREANVVSVE